MKDVAIMTVELNKLSKERPRTNFYTHSVYTPPQTKKRERIIAQEFLKQNEDWLCGKEPIILGIRIELEIPKSASKKDRQKMLEGEIKAVRKPDIDNTTKLVLDALNKVAYIDDQQIISLAVEKCYGEKNKLEIFVKKVL